MVPFLSTAKLHEPVKQWRQAFIVLCRTTHEGCILKSRMELHLDERENTFFDLQETTEEIMVHLAIVDLRA